MFQRTSARQSLPPHIPDRQSTIFEDAKPDLQLSASCSALQLSVSPAPYTRLQWNLLVLDALPGLWLCR
ncbi:Hypothetical predicted protein [Scomber scombrus]|uniref:Uncharacterized protein n=1 Tax=Scomber scombrus TaxID=13677 RepID=A0AAV1P772_SCOSC